MSESGFYPAGAYSDDRAPYNEKVIPERGFKMSVEFTMRKDRVQVMTDRYEEYYDEEYRGNIIDTSNTEWKDVYNENHHTIQELLLELESYILQDIERYKGFQRKELQLNALLEECRGWKVVDEKYEEA